MMPDADAAVVNSAVTESHPKGDGDIEFSKD